MVRSSILKCSLTGKNVQQRGYGSGRLKERKKKMALKAKAPEVKEKRLKMFVFGPAGVGKTTAAIQFPKSYIIDTEHGTDFYAESINKAGSVVFQTLNPDDIKEELR
jgi:GTPase SAR1 family protein